MRRSKDEWEKILDSYLESGDTVSRYCRSTGISEPSLRYQIKKLYKKSVRSEAAGTNFVEIGTSRLKRHNAVSGEGAGYLERRPGGLSIRFSNNVVIDVQADTNRDMLEWVLALMTSLR